MNVNFSKNDLNLIWCALFDLHKDAKSRNKKDIASRSSELMNTIFNIYSELLVTNKDNVTLTKKED